MVPSGYFSIYSSSNFSRFGPAINPTTANRTREATPAKIAEVLSSPTANVENDSKDMKNG